MSPLQEGLYYETLNLHALAIALKEIPAPELDIKHLMELNVVRISQLLNMIKEGE